MIQGAEDGKRVWDEGVREMGGGDEQEGMIKRREGRREGGGGERGKEEKKKLERAQKAKWVED